MINANLHAVILAGGSGTRLWPLSTKSKPKQFLSVGANESLLKQTVSRLEGLVSLENIWVVCGGGHAVQVKQELPDIKEDQILVEPEAKNTAPAIALAATHIISRDPKSIMMVLPADHLIYAKDSKRFSEDLLLASHIAKANHALITLGIQPDHPSTGFGYIERNQEHSYQGTPYYQVKAFHEKPELQMARQFLIQGNFYWNSGMFVWEAAVFLQELSKLQGAMAALFSNLQKTLGQKSYHESLKKVFQKVENISVDYAVMEHAENVLVVPARFGWDDIGNLGAFSKVLPSDSQDNHVEGKVWAIDSNGNLVISSTKPVALVGVKDMIVIEGDGAILILPKEKAQDVKKIVEWLKDKKETEYL